jgi:hypothetical protein
VLRLYLDEDAMSVALVRALTAAGVAVVTAAQEGMRGRSDAEQLAAATARNRVLYSFNVRDVARLHAEWMHGGHHHAGIVLVNDQRLPVAEQRRRLFRLGESLATEGLPDRIEYLGAWT